MTSHFALLFKILTLCGLILIMMIPMAMVMGVVKERAHYQKDVVDSVAQSSSYSQNIIGPIIVVPYTETTLEVRDKQKYYVQKKYVHYVLPQTLNVNATADISARHIGIYQAQIYQSELKFDGTFEQTSLDKLKNRENIKIDAPYLVVLISDTRGIMQVPAITLNDQKMNFEPGSIDRSIDGRGIHTPVELEQITSSNLNFNFSLQLQGTKELSVVPVGRSSTYHLKGNWPHPSFIGYTLPINRQINEKGFEAKWQSSWYANNINEIFSKDINLNYHESISIDRLASFKTGFVETVDQYQMTERAVKYDILFIFLTFICFFIFEMLKQLKIHPVQYLLVGMALTTFYLLLLALSEHIGFFLAYVCGAFACSLLIGFYLSTVLKGLKWGGMFTLFLLTLYAVLYLVMVSEGNALLLGSLVLFVILGGVMILTRKIDWYKVAQINIDKKVIGKDTNTISPPRTAN